MVWLNMNLVTIALALIIIMCLIRGMTREFSGESMMNSVLGIVNNILFLISLIASIYITKNIFFDKNEVSIYGKIYSAIPVKVSSYLADLGILLYLIVTPIILFIIFFILVYLRSLFDSLVNKISYWMCCQIKNFPKWIRALVGIILEIPRTIVITLIAVLLIGLCNTYYSSSKIAIYSEQSKLYNYIYSHTIYPALNSVYGRKIPVFLQNSINELSKDIASNKVLAESGKLNSIGLFRFQFETKSNEQIDNMAKKIVGKETDDRKKAYLLYKWVGNNISYDWDKYNDVVKNTTNNDKFGAIPAFNSRKGICEDYSDLYVAMAKAVGLKVRVIVGQGYSMNSWGGHAWNEVYITKENLWIPIDTTWAKAGNYFDNKDFYKTHIFEATAGEW